MNILLIGSGGREHALARALAKSTLCDKLICTPGNGGIGEIAECVRLDIGDHPAVIEFARKHEIGLVVIGPEAPLVAGLADDLEKAGIAAFGPGAGAARLEGSKGFTKDICARYGIPGAAYKRCSSRKEALAELQKRGCPVVIKADGLAAGKGVTIATSAQEAIAAVEEIFAGRFTTASGGGSASGGSSASGGGSASGGDGAELVIEDFLEGEEVSFFALCDGETALPLASAQDHKRVGDGDKGPNTGGMGAYSPAPVMTDQLSEQVMARIISPTLQAMRELGTPFKGVLFAGLMITDKGPQLIEYNVRFGDPECQVLMMRLKSDLVALMRASIEGTLSNQSAHWHSETALTVVMAAKGYPGSVETGSEIRGLEQASAGQGVEIFHAGTKREGEKLLANGGRVLNVTALGRSVLEAQETAYAALDKIDWRGGFCRRDIGWRAIAREKQVLK